MRTRNIVILLVILVALGGVYYWFGRPKPPAPAQPEEYVWSIQQDDINHITISLPSDNLSESWVKISNGDKFPWFFDDPQHSPVDTQRWGGGIPLLLSGPGADRVLTDNASADQLAAFGFNSPVMRITLTLSNNQIMTILVGNQTPTGNYYYVKAPGTDAVATVDYSWYNVLANLVTNPPYAVATSPTPAS